MLTVGCNLYEATEESSEDNNNKIVLIIDIVATITITVIITIWAKYEFDKRYVELESEMTEMTEN